MGRFRKIIPIKFVLQNKCNLFLMFMHLNLLLLLLLLIFVSLNNNYSCLAELVVNVKNQGGEIYQETISANVTEETIQLEFHQTDGTIVTQFLDFKNEIQIINTLILGDEELQREQAQFQILCFVTKFFKTDFVPPDAMAKLRQKNPWAVRTPEKDNGKENVTFDVLLDIRSTDWISPYIKIICSDAQNTYGKREELEAIVLLKSNYTNYNNNNESANPGHGIGILDSIEKVNEQFFRTVKPLFPVSSKDYCHPRGANNNNNNFNELQNIEMMSTVDKDKPCLCYLDQCIGWYPCALKYCRGVSTSSHEAKSYRCGIHTCKKCHRYYFSVSRKYSCIN